MSTIDGSRMTESRNALIENNRGITIYTLNRFARTSKGTFGALFTPNDLEFATVERPWLDNKPFVSCIPEGLYECAPRWYNRGKYLAIEILDVPDRTHILFHIANHSRHVAGCVGVNERLGFEDHSIRGYDSALGFNRLMTEARDTNFKLSINNI